MEKKVKHTAQKLILVQMSNLHMNKSRSNHFNEIWTTEQTWSVVYCVCCVSNLSLKTCE